jgi:hypothetical protein
MPAVPPARQDPTDPDIAPPDQKPGSERQPDWASARLPNSVSAPEPEEELLEHTGATSPWAA